MITLGGDGCGGKAAGGWCEGRGEGRGDVLSWNAAR